MSRLTDNEVREVINMQRHIDNLEEYLHALFMQVRGRTLYVPQKEDTNQSWFFEEVSEFLCYVTENHPTILADFRNRKQEEQRQQIRLWQEQRTKRLKPFWKRLFAVKQNT